jgi:hypothetical protein
MATTTTVRIQNQTKLSSTRCDVGGTGRPVGSGPVRTGVGDVSDRVGKGSPDPAATVLAADAGLTPVPEAAVTANAMSTVSHNTLAARTARDAP